MQIIAIRAVLVRLMENGAPVVEAQRVRIVESAHTGHGAELVIERAILLHQQHDVLDVAPLPPHATHTRAGRARAARLPA
jgi:hypothetical protein